MNEIKEVYTLSEAREVLRIGRTKSYIYCKTGQLEHRHWGNRILVPRMVIDSWLNGETEETLPCPQCNENKVKVAVNE